MKLVQRAPPLWVIIVNGKEVNSGGLSDMMHRVAFEWKKQNAADEVILEKREWTEIVQ